MREDERALVPHHRNSGIHQRRHIGAFVGTSKSNYSVPSSVSSHYDSNSEDAGNTDSLHTMKQKHQQTRKGRLAIRKWAGVLLKFPSQKNKKNCVAVNDGSDHEDSEPSFTGRDEDGKAAAKAISITNNSNQTSPTSASSSSSSRLQTRGLNSDSISASAAFSGFDDHYDTYETWSGASPHSNSSPVFPLLPLESKRLSPPQELRPRPRQRPHWLPEQKRKQDDCNNSHCSSSPAAQKTIFSSTQIAAVPAPVVFYTGESLYDADDFATYNARSRTPSGQLEIKGCRIMNKENDIYSASVSNKGALPRSSCFAQLDLSSMMKGMMMQPQQREGNIEIDIDGSPICYDSQHSDDDSDQAGAKVIGGYDEDVSQIESLSNASTSSFGFDSFRATHIHQQEEFGFVEQGTEVCYDSNVAVLFPGTESHKKFVILEDSQLRQKGISVTKLSNIDSNKYSSIASMSPSTAAGNDEGGSFVYSKSKKLFDDSTHSAHKNGEKSHEHYLPRRHSTPLFHSAWGECCDLAQEDLEIDDEISLLSVDDSDGYALLQCSSRRQKSSVPNRSPVTYGAPAKPNRRRKNAISIDKFSHVSDRQRKKVNDRQSRKHVFESNMSCIDLNYNTSVDSSRFSGKTRSSGTHESLSCKTVSSPESPILRSRSSISTAFLKRKSASTGEDLLKAEAEIFAAFLEGKEPNAIKPSNNAGADILGSKRWSSPRRYKKYACADTSTMSTSTSNSSAVALAEERFLTAMMGSFDSVDDVPPALTIIAPSMPATTTCMLKATSRRDRSLNIARERVRKRTSSLAVKNCASHSSAEREMSHGFHGDKSDEATSVSSLED